MSIAPSFTPKSVYYLPHHGVSREQSVTTKLRVVFNGSCNTSTDVSLNDILHTGPKIQRDISDVLSWIRRYRILFATDITKMFRQILVHPEDRDLQRILWLNSQGDFTPYRLNTVKYGTRCALYLSVRVLLQLIEDEGRNYPLAVDPLVKGRYVDDIYGGADTVNDAQLIAQQLISICKSAHFPLAKWSDNSSSLLSEISPQDVSLDNSVRIDDTMVKVSGLSWLSLKDQFRFDLNAATTSTIPKRTVLSEIARSFDPFGFLAPIVVRAKLILQELWLEKLSWDEPLTPSMQQRWKTFREELSSINTIEIPRWLNTLTNSACDIHGFSDASQLAMAAAVYIKVLTPDNNAKLTLECAKNQVAPLKRITIPRLELNAAVILSKLLSYVKSVLELENTPTYLWTDSSVTYTWIKSHPSRWKDYVRNRVTKIQELQGNSQWLFVPGKQNPADCASRGLSPSQLKDHTLWWTGPPWLQYSLNEWPNFKPPIRDSPTIEERPGTALTVIAKVPSHPLWDVLLKYSKFSKLLKITAICFRLSSRMRKIPNSSLVNPLNAADLENARNIWTKIVQSIYFAEEMKSLNKGNFLSRSNSLAQLTPFIDATGILRVGGRLRYCHLDADQIHPAILPRDSPLTKLIIAEAHQKTLHGGTQLTLAAVRRSWWICGGRGPIRSYILRCVTCARHRGLRAQQLMGQLPAPRVTPSRAFLHTGVDYAGPVTLKTWKGRGAKTHKGWIAVFVCFSTLAVHLELVTDYPTDAFIAAYRRFSSRRGICSTLYSDSGTNFLGADATLKLLFEQGTKEGNQLSSLLLNDGTTWKSNPPGAPHFGGKWEAAVKSVKFHLQRTISDTLLTSEELSTLLNQVEAILNSRPLAALSDDPTDLSALTPGHFLIGEALTTVPEPSLGEVRSARLSSWQLIQQKLQYFWKRWSFECLQRYQEIWKWHNPSNSTKQGSLVLISDERFPPSKWPLARVTHLHPGKDGLTTAVSIKTATSTLVRPITKLCLLPVATEENNAIADFAVDPGENVEKR